MADPVLDYTETWNRLMKEIKRYVATLLPEVQYQIQEAWNQFNARPKSSNMTNIKSCVKIVTAHRKKDPNWLNAYRYDITYDRSKERDELTWDDFWIKYEEEANEDLIHVRSDIDEEGSLFYGVPIELPDSPPPGASRFDRANHRHSCGEVIAEGDARSWGGVIKWRGEDGDKKRLIDGVLTIRGIKREVDVKTWTGNEHMISVEVESFRKCVKADAILLVIINPESQDAWRGAINAKEFDPLMFEFFGEPDWPGVEAQKADIMKKYPGADVTTVKKWTKVRSNMPSVLIPKSALVPIAEFYERMIKQNGRTDK